jgi:hypothetical protein
MAVTMTRSVKFTVELDKFRQSHARFGSITYPAAVALAMKELTQEVQKDVRKETEKNFDLKTNWIPKNINNFPNTPGQMAKVKNDLKRSGRFFASVSASDRIAFMSGHDTGLTRNPDRPNRKLQKFEGLERLAIPSYYASRELGFRSATGKILNRWSPKSLLKDYNGVHGKKNKTNSKKPFIIESKKSGHMMIVRRKSKKHTPLQVLYHFKASAKIKDDWGFTEKGYSSAQSNYNDIFAQVWRKIDSGLYK